MDIQEQQNPIQECNQQPGQSYNQKMMEQVPQIKSQQSTSMDQGEQNLWGYQIHKGEKLGKGAFGKVYKATKPNPKPYQQKQAAVKIFPTPTTNTYDHLSMKRQIDILKTKKNQHVIKFLFHASFKGKQYIFMEMAKGDLKEVIYNKSNVLIPEGEAVKTLRQIIQGLYELHDSGIIHRDLKPENIFLVKDKNHNNNVIAKIGDFNLSRGEADYTEKTAGIGTPIYMAPQLYKKVTKEGKSKYSYKCDIWSLGVIAYEIVCGKTPWPTCFTAKQLFMHIEQTVKNGIKFPQDIPISEEYKDFVRGCLQLEEKDRFEWKQIFHHPLIDYQDPIEIEYINTIVTDLRRQVQQSNIHLYSFFKDLPENLSKQNVYNIFKALNHEIAQDEIELLNQALFPGQITQIDLSEFVAILQKNSFNFEKEMIRSKEEQYFWDLDSVSKIYKNISSLSNKPFEQCKFFSHWIKTSPKMNYELFEKMMKSLSSKATKKHLDKFYRYFNKDNFIQINTDTFVKQFCQFFQIVRYQDPHTEKQINKMKIRKFQEMNEKEEMMEDSEMKE